eukprot:g7111.t1
MHPDEKNNQPSNTLCPLCNQQFIAPTHTWICRAPTAQAQLLRRIAHLREITCKISDYANLRPAGSTFLTALLYCILPPQLIQAHVPVLPIQLLNLALESCVRYNTTLPTPTARTILTQM